MKPLAWATLVAQIAIVVTGGAVRLTGSGLGCPTWPRCTDESFSPHGELEFHSAIEFGNRMLTFALVAIAVATFVVAWRTRRRELRLMSLIIALGIPAQAVIGGITVLTDLNPWLVALHLLCSMAIIGVSVRLLLSVEAPLPPARRGPPAVLAWATFATAWVVLYLGTVVTGSGPHAGDARTERNGLDPLQMSQLHADIVFLFMGLVIGLLVTLHVVGGPATVRARRAVVALLVISLAQGTIGFVQYFTDLPEVLVGFHMLGAALVSASVTWVLLRVRRPVV
ncbi:heme A synthase [Nocardioides sp. YIM 123512]|uniref:Heme A synthase n=2 Tax=Nocardioides flavescens TaxID=2691959 RepID=A0A6L7EN55_9ACTN|nr:heme A synthase [Nocardioides flavescens]